MDISEKKLELVQDDPRFFGIIYEKYMKEIYSYAYYLSSNKHKAEDITSVTFMKALEKFDTFDGDESKLRAWLYSIARNHFIDETRKKKNQELNLFVDYDAVDEASLSDEVQTKLVVQEIIKYVNDLEPPIYCEVLILRYKQELEIDEIAEIVGKTEKNVRTTISRAMAKLRDKCEELM